MNDLVEYKYEWTDIKDAPVKHRLVCMYSLFDGITPEQIGSIVGLVPATVKRMLEHPPAAEYVNTMKDKLYLAVLETGESMQEGFMENLAWERRVSRGEEVVPANIRFKMLEYFTDRNPAIHLPKRGETQTVNHNHNVFAGEAMSDAKRDAIRMGLHKPKLVENEAIETEGVAV